MIRDPRSRLSTVLREALPWLAFADGDPLALCLIEGYGRPSRADDMADILDAIAGHERRWRSGSGVLKRQSACSNQNRSLASGRSSWQTAAPSKRALPPRKVTSWQRSATKKGLGTMWTRRSLSITAKDGIVSKELDGQQLEQVKKALARIDMGTYGMSEVSGKPIPIDRLEACHPRLPWSTKNRPDRGTRRAVERESMRVTPDHSRITHSRK